MNPGSFLISLVTYLVSLLASFSLPLSLQSNAKPTPITQRVATPSVKLEQASTSATIPMPRPAEPIQTAQPPVPWGTTENLGNHLYRTYVANDPTMGTPDEILTALNSYRKNHNVGNLSKDDGLCRLAQTRAENQDKNASLDDHKGLIEYMNDPNHWRKLNITGIGENASSGYTLTGVHLIEWVFDSDSEHRQNQLDPNWNLACAAVAGTTVDIIYAKR